MSAVLSPKAVQPPGSTASRASGSSFYAAMRLMPKAERSAMFAIYDFCRKVDDVADEPGPTREERRALLDQWRADVNALYAGTVAEAVSALAGPIARYQLEQEDFLAVIDGMQMDVETDIRAPTYEVLDLYCDRVASAVGRLSVRVFGMAREPGIALAHHLGRALQLTNILRDLDEDAAIGRLYLPARGPGDRQESPPPSPEMFLTTPAWTAPAASSPTGRAAGIARRTRCWPLNRPGL